jgi:hypothetical protein
VIGENILVDLGFAPECCITDFTIVGFQFLVLLIESQLVVFDCEPVLHGSARSVRYMMSIAFENKENYSRVEALEDGIPRSILVLGKQATQALLVSFSDFECTLETKLEIPGKLETR